MLADSDLTLFRRQGFLVLRGLGLHTVDALRDEAISQLDSRDEPLELEASVGYPGAPEADSPGATCVRRLLNAYDRSAKFAQWATSSELAEVVRDLLNIEPNQPVHLSRAHHNCVMTKMPQWSSRTEWHQDVRYWNFSNTNLINAWLALTPESTDNGGLWLLPGSHRWALETQHLDDDLFLRTDHPDIADRMGDALALKLMPGDTLFFSAALFHSAGWNRTSEAKLSLVTTYHGTETQPLPDSRSSRLDEVVMEPAGKRSLR